jgi:hypothetical protein
MTTGVLPYRTFKDWVLMNTGFFECSSTDLATQQGTSSGNHDGAGMSMGNLQYNFGSANRLNELWNYMLDNFEQDCIDAFGANTTQYNTWKTAVRSTVQQDKINFGANITDPNNSHAVIQPYKDAFATLGNKQSHIDKYKAMADAYYFPAPELVFLTSSAVSRLAYASLFDTYINKGRYYPVNLITADFDRIDADTTIDATEKERQKIYQINYRGNYDNAVKPTTNADGTIDQVTFWDGSTAGAQNGRRGCMANQTGNYYGLVYDPDVQFDMNQEPAMSQKAATTGIDFGNTNISAVYQGNTKISNIYFGSIKLGSGMTATTSSAVPKTQFRTNAGSYAGIGTATSVTLSVGQPLWIDCQENPSGTLVACRTYYTTDGSTPTTNSALYTDALTFDTSVTLKTLTVSTSGVAEAVKTLTVNVAAPPVTTISPSATVQNAIPITVTLTSSEQGATIYYKIGSNATQYTYTAPFQVSQDSAGVLSTQIPVTYWSVGANGTETAKSITYDTSGALPVASTLTATAGNNQVNLSWTAAANVTSYTVYRSTTSGALGTWIGTSQYLSKNTTSLIDTGVTAGTTYYYTVYSNNYQTHAESSQKSATPTAAPSKASWRYLKIQGYGTATDTTSRIIEFEAISAGVNRMTGATILSSDAPNNTGTAAQIKDGVKTTTANSYPLYWTAVPNANIVVDLGTSYAIDQMNYYSYSVSGDQRENRFKILGSNTNNGTDWTTVWDNSTGQLGLQPLLPSGYNATF